jgi:hypothetical protein
MRIRRPASHCSFTKASGTRVVLPAPGAATKTALPGNRSDSFKAGKIASIGNWVNTFTSLEHNEKALFAD